MAMSAMAMSPVTVTTVATARAGVSPLVVIVFGVIACVLGAAVTAAFGATVTMSSEHENAAATRGRRDGFGTRATRVAFTRVRRLGRWTMRMLRLARHASPYNSILRIS